MKSVLQFAVLALVLGGLAACSDDTGEEAPLFEVTILDPTGKPATEALATVRRGSLREDAPPPTWDAATATLRLPRVGAPHTFRVAMKGIRTTLVSDVSGPRIVTLARGFPVEVRVKSEAPPPQDPRCILIRVRPDVGLNPETDPKAAARITEVCQWMYPRHGPEDGSLPLLPTRFFGFGLAEVDAANGFRVPEPGAYVVQWGLMDRAEGTVQMSAAAPQRFVVLESQTENLRIDVAITAAEMQQARRQLRARIEAFRKEDASASSSDANKQDDGGEVHDGNALGDE